MSTSFAKYILIFIDHCDDDLLALRWNMTDFVADCQDFPDCCCLHDGKEVGDEVDCGCDDIVVDDDASLLHNCGHHGLPRPNSFAVDFDAMKNHYAFQLMADDLEVEVVVPNARHNLPRQPALPRIVEPNVWAVQAVAALPFVRINLLNKLG